MLLEILATTPPNQGLFHLLYPYKVDLFRTINELAVKTMISTLVVSEGW
jgi:hypothetical protein